MDITRQILVIIEETVELLEVAAPLQVFAASNGLARGYELVTVSAGGGLVATSAGLALHSASLAAIDPSAVDTALVVGGARGRGVHRQALVGWLREHGSGVRRMCGIGRGADLLRESGLAASADLALHWLRSGRGGAGERSAPIVRRRGRIWTCAGGSSAVDLALALVEEDFGAAQAYAVAEALLLPVRRFPDDPQVGRTLALQVRGGAPFAGLLRRMRDNLAGDLSVERLADWCHMTPRTFARRFAREVGTTPAAAAAAMRTEAAEALLRTPGLKLKEIAALCGFGSELSLRRALERSRGRPGAG